MKVGDLEMHCGECPIISFCCSDPFDYAACSDPRIQDMDASLYEKLADGATNLSPGKCLNCSANCDECEYDSERRDYMARRFTEHVLASMRTGNIPEEGKRPPAWSMETMEDARAAVRLYGQQSTYIYKSEDGQPSIKDIHGSYYAVAPNRFTDVAPGQCISLSDILNGCGLQKGAG